MAAYNSDALRFNKFESIDVCDGATNMAMDRSLLDLAETGKGCFRIYAWTEPTVSLGFSQSPSRDLNLPCPVQHVQRPTGGRAVLHGHDVTIGLAVNLLQSEFESRKLRSIYASIIEPIRIGLIASGVDARFGRSNEDYPIKPRSSDCFAHIAANDLIDYASGNKICGCALRVTDKAVLVQASIPVSPPLVDPALVFRHPANYANLNIDANTLGKALTESLARFLDRKCEAGRR